VRHVRQADVNEVLSAGLHFDEATRKEIIVRQPFSVWLLESCDDLGGIGSQLQRESEGADSERTGRICDLYAGWVKWMHSGHAKAVADLCSHAHLKGMLHQGQMFATRAIVFDARLQIHDGRHRLFALYEFVLGGGQPPHVEVFWNKAA
jgi:hypothetical protein